MIKQITVTNYLNEAITMELGFPDLSGFLVRSITGLGPPKANINSTELATGDGSLYNSAKVQPRNIVLALAFLDNPSIEEVRLLSYKYFPIKKQIKFQIETDSRVGEIMGYVESNEPNIFSNKTGTQISILCHDPYFYSNQEFVVASSPAQTANASYVGDVEVGIVLTLTATGNVGELVIRNNTTSQEITIDAIKLVAIVGAPGIIAGDQIIISTLKNNKYVKLLRGGIYTNILNALDRDTDWIVLTKGNNLIEVTASPGMYNFSYEVRYRMVYEGV